MSFFAKKKNKSHESGLINQICDGLFCCNLSNPSLLLSLCIQNVNTTWVIILTF